MKLYKGPFEESINYEVHDPDQCLNERQKREIEKELDLFSMYTPSTSYMLLNIKKSDPSHLLMTLSIGSLIYSREYQKLGSSPMMLFSSLFSSLKDDLAIWKKERFKPQKHIQASTSPSLEMKGVA